MRKMLSSERALAFGFISSKNAAHLVALGIPFLFGEAPGELHLERLIAASATKILGPIGWIASPASEGVEDRYLFLLQPAVISRLAPLTITSDADDETFRMIPADVRSLTIYKYADPLAAWQSFESAVGSQLDTLSAVVFDSFLESALAPYGIQKPKQFLAAVNSNIISIRRAADPEHSLLIAKLRDKQLLYESLQKFSKDAPREQTGANKIWAELETGAAVASMGQHIILGPYSGVRDFVQATEIANENNSGLLRQPTRFVPRASTAGVVTYSDDSERMVRFVTTLMQLNKQPHDESAQIKQLMGQLPFSATETILTDLGFERRTRSSFGLFALLVPLLKPEEASSR